MPGLVPRAICMGLVVCKSNIGVGFPQSISVLFRQCSTSSHFICQAPTPYDISSLQRHYVEPLQNDTQIMSFPFFHVPSNALLSNHSIIPSNRLSYQERAAG
jgi:hypothetical protein